MKAVDSGFQYLVITSFRWQTFAQSGPFLPFSISPGSVSAAKSWPRITNGLDVVTSHQALVSHLRYNRVTACQSQDNNNNSLHNRNRCCLK